jgi:NAD(P)-dependent dehydrogenase (short-subunit alcohol dehydrogenase family)
MDLNITGRTAVVTGGNRGIGAAIVRGLESEGVNVVPVSRGSGIDVTDPAAPQRIAEQVGAPVDILVNNAGMSGNRPLHELTDEEWQAQLDLHVMAPMRLMRHFAPLMAERGWGRIVNVTTSTAKRPSSTNASYTVSKVAEQALSRVFADNYAGKGVLVNAVAPGPTGGELWLGEGGLLDQMAAQLGVSRDEALQVQRGKVPTGRLGEEDEIAAVVVFLCSERASFVAGSAWSVDGGIVPTFM